MNIAVKWEVPLFLYTISLSFFFFDSVPLHHTNAVDFLEKTPFYLYQKPFFDILVENSV